MYPTRAYKNIFASNREDSGRALLLQKVGNKENKKKAKDGSERGKKRYGIAILHAPVFPFLFQAMNNSHQMLIQWFPAHQLLLTSYPSHSKNHSPFLAPLLTANRLPSPATSLLPSLPPVALPR